VEIIQIQYPLQDLAAEAVARPKSLAIGYFDGVHRGHQHVINHAVEGARTDGIEAAVMTFHPHPKEVLGKGEQYATCLTPLEEKLDRFRELGVDTVYVVRFDSDFAAILPEQFVTDVLRPLRVQRVVVGFDFTFGARGAGNAAILSDVAGPEIIVNVIEPLTMNGEKVSSSYVRASLAEGRPEVAESLLGKPYAVQGTVVRGDGRGRTIGFPTANLELAAAYVTPRLGVYAITVELSNGSRHLGILNIGMKPTFHEALPAPVMEAHLLGYEGDLYGQVLRVEFVAFLRAEKKFTSVQELIDQIQTDAGQAKTVLAELS